MTKQEELTPQLVSIIINHHRTPKVLMMCLDAIKEKFVDIDYEIILTDSETDENSIAPVLQKHPNLIFLREPGNIGFSRSMNPAIALAKGRYLFMINADIIAHDGESIVKMIKYLEDHPNAGIIGPKLLNLDGSIQPRFREYTLLTVLARRTIFGKTAWGRKILRNFTYQDDDENEIKAIEWISGSCMLVDRERFAKVGPYFDDRFFMYFEDVDLCRRFRTIGMQVIYFPAATFTHYHIRQSQSNRGILDFFTNWLTRVHVHSYFKYLWKWRIERLFHSVVKWSDDGPAKKKSG